MIGQLLNGAGCSPLLSLGTTFMDEAVGAKSSPVYIAIFQMWLVIGPALGYVIGGQLLLIHTDLVQDSNISPASPLWVGAWWPGFFITGSVCFVAALAFFPADFFSAASFFRSSIARFSSTKTCLCRSASASQTANSSSIR